MRHSRGTTAPGVTSRRLSAALLIAAFAGGVLLSAPAYAAEPPGPSGSAGPGSTSRELGPGNAYCGAEDINDNQWPAKIMSRPTSRSTFKAYCWPSTDATLLYKGTGQRVKCLDGKWTRGWWRIRTHNSGITGWVSPCSVRKRW